MPYPSESAARVLFAERGLEPTVDYPGSSKPWPSIHLACGRIVRPVYSQLKNARNPNSTGCRPCFLARQFSGTRRIDYLLATYREPEAHDPGWLYSTAHGYGQFSQRVEGVATVRRVHAYVCELVNGPRRSPGLVARHSCSHNRACFFAGHLSWGTRGENAADRLIHDFDLLPPSQRYTDLTITDWQRIRLLRASGTTLTAIGQAWEISIDDVRAILKQTALPLILEPWPGD